MKSIDKWRVSLDGWLWHQPVVDKNTLFVRSGGDLVAISVDDGDVRWKRRVDPNDSTGQFLLSSSDVLVGSRNVADRTVLVAVDRNGNLAWEVETGAIIVDAVAATDKEIVAFGGAAGGYRFFRVDCASGTFSEHAVPLRPDRIAIDHRGIVGSRRDTPGLVRFDDVGMATHWFSEQPVYGFAATSAQVAIVALVDDEYRLRMLSPELETQWEQAATSSIVGADDKALLCTARSKKNAVELLDPATGETQWISEPLADEFVCFTLFDKVIAVRGLTQLWVLSRASGEVLSEHLMGSSLTVVDDSYFIAAMKVLSRHAWLGV